MSYSLIQQLHAAISRRDWSATEAAANRIRDDVDAARRVLAGTQIVSLPNDYSLSSLASDAKIIFGLEAQGHLSTIEEMIADGADWGQIGKRICWDGETAKEYYQRHLARTSQPTL